MLKLNTIELDILCGCILNILQVLVIAFRMEVTRFGFVSVEDVAGLLKRRQSRLDEAPSRSSRCRCELRGLFHPTGSGSSEGPP